MERLNKACPDCETYLTVGVQYAPDDPKDEIPTAFLFVKDFATSPGSFK
jgi:hypothetical protein